MRMLCLRLAARIMKVGEGRVKYNGKTEQNMKDALACVSRESTRLLIQNKIIVKKPIRGISRGRKNKNTLQKNKGKQKGEGNRFGSRKTRDRRRMEYVSRIRAVRDELRKSYHANEIKTEEYRYHYRQLRTVSYNTRQKVRIKIKDGIYKK